MWIQKKSIALSVTSIENFKNLKQHIHKLWFILLFVTSVTVKMKKYLKKKNQLRYKIDLANNLNE